MSYIFFIFYLFPSCTPWLLCDPWAIEWPCITEFLIKCDFEVITTLYYKGCSLWKQSLHIMQMIVEKHWELRWFQNPWADVKRSQKQIRSITRQKDRTKIKTFGRQFVALWFNKRRKKFIFFYDLTWIQYRQVHDKQTIRDKLNNGNIFVFTVV